MNRLRKDLSRSNGTADCVEQERRLRALAVELKPDGEGSLRLAAGCASRLRRLLRRATCMDARGDEALRRLKADAGRIEACLRQAQGDAGANTPFSRGRARVKALANALLCGGERSMSREQLLTGLIAFDGGRPMSMREIQQMPTALLMAMCEAMEAVARDILRFADARAAAEKWVSGGGRGRLGANCGAAFFEHALQLCLEMERPELHARVERVIAGRKMRPECLLEEAHRIAADNCLRLDNLMKLKYLLDALDWQKCFEQIAPAEIELRDDPARVYGAMDDSSRARVREAVAELSDCWRTRESVVVRHALEAARRVCDAEGAQAPRATVCWYLTVDAGREELRRALGVSRCPRRWIPDASGRGSVALMGGLTLAVAAACVWAMHSLWLAIYALPLAWEAVTQLVGRFYPLWCKPATLLKLKLDRVPESARTLVVLPVLLSSEARVREMAAHMEALGCLERDENVDFLLLGDFKESEREAMPEDGAILEAARSEIAALNRRAEREKYFYLHRGRTFREQDAKWMGENRKRGALMALNRLLLGRGGAEAFAAEWACATRLKNRYRYVVTLDADTEYLPGTIQRLVGAMLHPINRARPSGEGYAVLQPAMQLTAEANVNAYVALTNGLGGVDSYPVAISDFYQDMSGRGCFAGKGVYDVKAFTDATEGQLPDNDVLSHDLIEGILSGAGFAGDVCFYDGCPDALEPELMRLHRWTRGDWQLLPVLVSKRGIAAIDRMKMVGNLLRSLYAPALMGLFLHSAWIDAPGAFALGLLLAFLNPLLHLAHGGRRAWRAALMRLATLPATAACQLDAILRTLWRVLVSHRHLMEWVPAADASGSGQNPRLACRLGALLMLPALLRPLWVPAALGMAALFFIGADWARDLSRTPADGRARLSAGQAEFLTEIARRTWRFFADFVPWDGLGLPPDNVQIDPPVGAAPRTSPTNIGLYLMSCLSAREMDFIAREEMIERMAAAVSTMERMEKWRGQLYNWYDIQTLEPLRPRYVSAVDSGNLAGALLLCAQGISDADDALARRMRALAEGMDLVALYDGERDLFCIGMDVENGRLSESHYDLYASEARILSYAAMMMGQAPVKHWQRLSRASVRVGRHQALISWSGTMFEYLMPEILLRSRDNTLAGQSRRGVAACQKRLGKELNRPWGVSESGYYAFDLRLNYQYRAFGLRALALSGNAVQDVVSPYSSALMLCCDPVAATENLRRMCELGWQGDYGMFEAADYLRPDPKGNPRLVRSYMAHHQGMALCAMCNALRGDVLANLFMEIPQARALRLLLQEKQGARVRLRRVTETDDARRTAERADVDFIRVGKGERCAADVQLLSGGGATALVTARGAAYVWNRGLQLNRFSGSLTDPHEGMYVHLTDLRTGEKTVMGGGRCVFEAGSACCQERFCGLKAQLRMALSPEDGTFYQIVEIENPTAEARALDVTACMAVALAAERDMRAHPVFQNMFVESEVRDGRTLVFHRRPRKPEEDFPRLICRASGGDYPRCETSLEALVGRQGSLGEAGGLADELGGRAGCTLNPCAALRLRASVGAGERARLHFAWALSEEEDADACIRRISDGAQALRAAQLADSRARAVLAHAALDGRRCALLQRASALLFDPKLRPALSARGEACEAFSKAALWSAGISGDLPILLVEFGRDGQMNCVRDAIRMHAFYRTMGVQTDFVVLNNYGSDYLQPARGALGDLIASSHLNGSFGKAGGAHVLERQNLSEETCAAVRRAAAIRLNAEEDVEVQLRGMLDQLILRSGEGYVPMRSTRCDVPDGLRFFNGYGGFNDGGEYLICLREDRLPPAPWCNALSSERAGAMLTERGGGFAWHGNSRSGRITPFLNDALREGWGWMFYLSDAASREYLRLLPGDRPMTDFNVCYSAGLCRYAGRAEGLCFETRVRALREGICFEIEIKNEGEARTLSLTGFVDWLMGTDAADGGVLRTWPRFGACFASGATEGVGVFASDDLRAAQGCDRLSFLSGGTLMEPRGWDQLDVPQGGWTLTLPLKLKRGDARTLRFLLGAADNVAAAYALARDFRAGALREEAPLEAELPQRLRIDTPDEGLNLLANGFLWAQLLNARVRGRTGLYQPGGAFGFRDQLQDMLPLIYVDPARVRRHLLYCAARQFESGDVLHWWHEPYTGVRTKISDDLLFLPYVAARYVSVTGDDGVLADCAPFLEDVEIPMDAEDVYAPMRPTAHCASLHEHCMRAFRRAARTGEHGLCLMGGGDWNDGMNRVGSQGRGESVWLSEFLAVCAADYARVAPAEEDRAWLTGLNERLCAAVEASGWDGDWYLRAYADDGAKLGGAQGDCCRIDVISQAWAVLAELDEARCQRAMDAAWERLADEDLQIIRLLTPPFDRAKLDPGYIAAYPEGVRENGAQYTHAACWMLCALVEMGDGTRAHRALSMLNPINHALDERAAEVYRVEPYVMAADVYANPQHAGRGGWTWYTGSAAWMLMGIFRLLGFERRENRVRLNTLLGAWPEAGVTLRYGNSAYHLVCRRDARRVELDDAAVDGDWIEMRDDAGEHWAVFPPRQGMEEAKAHAGQSFSLGKI